MTRDLRRVGARRRLVDASSNVALVSVLVRRRLRHDPVAAALTAAALLPRGARDRAARAVLRTSARSAVGVRAALGHWLAGHGGHAVEALQQRRPGGAHIRRQLAGELSVHLGDETISDAAHPDLTAVSTARRLWRQGHTRAAVRAVDRPDTRHEHARLSAELTVLTPGFRLRPPGVNGNLAKPPGPPGVNGTGLGSSQASELNGHSTGSSGPPGLNGHSTGSPVTLRKRFPTVLHLLNNSLPGTQSGYTVRTQSVLQAHESAGLGALGVTRIGYPVNTGRPWAAHEVLVDGVRYRRMLPRRMGPLRTTRLQHSADLLARMVEEEGVDVLVATTRFENALVVEAVARATGLPWVYEVRGALEDTWLSRRPATEQEQAEHSDWYRASQAREVEMACAADHVVTLSATMRDLLTARGVPAECISVVANGIDPDLLRRGQRPAEARDRLGLPTDGFWIGAVSSLVPYEGFEQLIHAVVALREQGLDARCLLVGEGPSLPGLRELAQRLGVGDVVVLPGARPHRYAPDWVQALDVVALPRVDSRVTRSVTPQKPIETMALNRPLIVTDLPALAEPVRSAGAGLIVPPGDLPALTNAMHRLHDDPHLRAGMGSRGRALATGRTWEHVGRRYRAIYAVLPGNSGCRQVTANGHERRTP